MMHVFLAYIYEMFNTKGLRMNQITGTIATLSQVLYVHFLLPVTLASYHYNLLKHQDSRRQAKYI